MSYYANPALKCSDGIKARVCWKLDGKTGKGELIQKSAALVAVESMNKKHGYGTHWLELMPSSKY